METNMNWLSRISNQGLSISQKVSESTEDEIKQVLRYIITLIGVPAESIPDRHAKLLMLNYIKEKWAQSEISEMKQAFESCVQNDYREDGKSILNLYGKPFNIAFIRSVVLKHREFVNRNQVKVITPNLYKVAAKAFEILEKENPETYEKLKSIGKEKPVFEKFVPREKNTNERLMDAWLNRFEEIAFKQSKIKLTRIIEIGFGGMRIDDYLKYRLENYQTRFGLDKLNP